MKLYFILYSIVYVVMGTRGNGRFRSRKGLTFIHPKIMSIIYNRLNAVILGQHMGRKEYERVGT